MDFDLLIRDIQIYVACKFEMFIIIRAQVLKHYIRFAFLFVQTVDSIPPLPKSETSSLDSSSVVVQPGLCPTWSETTNTVFLMTRLNYIVMHSVPEYKSSME